MRKLSIAMGLLLALVLAAPPDAAGQKKPKEQAATAADYKFLENVKEIEGEITSLEPLTKQMTLKAGYAYLEPNPSYRPNNKANAQYTRRVNQLGRDWQRALAIQNPLKRIQRLQQLSVQMQAVQLQAPVGPSPFRPAMAYKDVDADATEEVVVRRLTLPLEYDDKGNVKEYTKEEKKELRGKDPKVPGYAAKWEDVQVGQKVKLYLKSKKALDKAKKSLAAATKKDASEADKETLKSASADADKEGPKTTPAATDKAIPKTAPAEPKTADTDKTDAKSAEKDKAAEDKTKTDDAEKEPRVHVTMILIEAEPDPAATPAKTPRKKRKQDDN
jgi:hypothetical protein